jgi:hypothetical protein
MLVQLDNIWLWRDGVLVQEDLFGALRMGAIGFREDDGWWTR